MEFMDADRSKELTGALEELLPTLVEKFEPEMVILFCSLARGDVGEWSDLDLLIVKETSEPFLQRSKEVALLCCVLVGVDYLVYTPDELDEMIERGNPFILEVLQEGHTLYDRRIDPALA
jgi:predicted nucleotidyltransferase